MAFCFAACPGRGQENYEQLREQMVKTQLLARDIRNPATLRAMRTVPRHEFVPEKLKNLAYADGALLIGQGQTISQPYMVAFMTQALRLKQGQRVLEVGTGSGYQAAVLAELTDSVYTIEIIPELGNKAAGTLESLGYKTVQVRIGDGYHGWPEKAPFDAIIVTAGAEEIPEALLEQLSDGGRMVIPVGPHHAVRRLMLVRRKGDRFLYKDLMAVRFVPFTRHGDH